MAVPVRGRDLRANIKEHGFDRGVVMTIEAFLDEYAETRQHLREVVELLDHCIDELGKLSMVGDGIAKQVNQIRREQKNEESGE